VPKIIACKFILMHIYPRNCCKFTFHLIGIVRGSKIDKKNKIILGNKKGSTREIPCKFFGFLRAPKVSLI